MLLTTDQELPKLYARRLDILRLIAICSIVWGHCLCLWDNQTGHKLLRSVIMELGRVGTINFFLISGYFLAGKITGYTLRSYLLHRLFPVIIPWFLFLSLFVCLALQQTFSLKQMALMGLFKTLDLWFQLFKGFIFHAAYWFIPVAILSASFVVIFKKYIHKAWFGILACVITLFYSANLYHGWVAVNHTRAFFGYIFFVWLGMQVNFNTQRVSYWLSRFSWPAFIAVLLAGFALTNLEGLKLSSLHSSDPYASIRLSNWLFSIVLFFAFLKSRRLQWVSNFKPRSYVYGIYLIHSIVIAEFLPGLISLIARRMPAGLMGLLLEQTFLFLTVLIISLLFVYIIKKSPLRFMIGIRAGAG